MQVKLSLAAALLAGGAFPTIHAADTAEPIVVTATRTAETVDESLAAVSVLSRADIEASQARSLTELLAGLPGVQVATNGGYGKTSSVYLRGTNSNHVLVLIDGMRIGSATLGSVAFEDLPLEAVERIEVVRGPRSSLYGADAIGGVIQIFTRGGSGTPRLRADAGAGSHDTYRLAAGLGGSHGNTRYDLDVSRFATGGFDSRDNNDPDRDGYERNAVNARIDHEFSAEHSLGLSAMRSEGRNEYDGWDMNQDYENDTVQQVLTARWRIAPTEWWHSSLTVGESRDELVNYADDIKGDEFHTRRRQLSWQNDLQLGDTLLLTLGADHLTDRITTTVLYARSERDNTGAFAQGQFSLGSHDWLVGLRHDDNDTYGAHTTGNIGWGYRMASGPRLTASYGTAFKAPSFNDLYYQDPWGSSGNPDLEPEQSASSELGVQDRFPGGHWRLRAYRTLVDNLIQWEEVAPWIWQPNNVGSARIDGIEFGLGATLGEWALALTLDLIDARDTTTDNRLTNRARETARLDLGRRYGRLHTQLTWLAVGRRYADAANTQEITGYGVINTTLRYELATAWRLEGRIDNLFDQPYQEVRGYNTAGRTLFVGLSYRP